MLQQPEAPVSAVTRLVALLGSPGKKGDQDADPTSEEGAKKSTSMASVGRPIQIALGLLEGQKRRDSRASQPTA